MEIYLKPLISVLNPESASGTKSTDNILVDVSQSGTGVYISFKVKDAEEPFLELIVSPQANDLSGQLITEAIKQVFEVLHEEDLIESA